MDSNEVSDYYDECHIDYRILWRVNHCFSLHYGFYDAEHTSHGEALINLNRVLAETAKIRGEEKVLDAGCGVGGTSLWIAKNLGAHVTGLNINDMQVEKANELAEKNKLSNLISFVKGDYTKTDFPDESFDVVLAIESVCHAGDKRDFIREAFRILKKGGRLVVSDGFLKKENLNLKEQKEMRRWLDGWAVPNLAYVDEFRTYLEGFGFSNIVFRDVRENIMPSSKRLYNASILVYPMSKLFELFGLRTQKQTANVVAAYYQNKTLKKNLWTYGIFYAEK